MSLPTFQLHPASVRQVQNGHFWIYEDEYTQKFTKSAPFFIGTDQRRKPVGVFLHDPNHKKIKARLWKKETTFSPTIFFAELEDRIRVAIIKRNEIVERDNVFLVFAEADGLPGLEVLKLGTHIIIRSYSRFWEKHINNIIKILQKRVGKNTYWHHPRTQGSNTYPQYIEGPKEHVVKIQEFGVHYQLMLGKTYDYGIYTDASALRFDLTGYFEKAESFLNLFSYTGAFSLYAHQVNNKIHTTSVDLSEKYLDIFKSNSKINHQKNHTVIEGPVKQILRKLQNEQQTFDLILIDPPPSSTDGKKMMSALQSYPEYICQMNKVLARGGAMVLLLNHRQVSRDKFKKMIAQTLKSFKLPLKVEKEWQLNQDCGVLPRFSESDYLKGYILRHD